MPRWVWAVIAWAVVVAATSTLAWVAISRAGDQVLGGAAPAPLPTTSGAQASGTQTSGTQTSVPTVPPSSPSSSGTGSASTGPPSAAPVDESVTVTGGHVSVRCTGNAVSLRGASPASGWTMRNDTRADEVRIEFRSDAGESKVRATCVDGEPSIETDDAED